MASASKNITTIEINHVMARYWCRMLVTTACEIPQIHIETETTTTVLLVIFVRYFKGVAKAKYLSTVRNSTCPTDTIRKPCLNIKIINWERHGPVPIIPKRRYHEAAPGITNSPIVKSAIASERRIKLVGEVFSIFNGSFQTATMTSAFPTTVITDRRMYKIPKVVACPWEFSVKCLANSSIIIFAEAFQKYVLPNSAAILRSISDEERVVSAWIK